MLQLYAGTKWHENVFEIVSELKKKKNKKNSYMNVDLIFKAFKLL